MKKIVSIITAALSCLLTTAAFADQQSDPSQSMASFCSKLPRPAYKDFHRLDINSDWFEVYQIAPGVSAIYEPHQWQEVISYLIEGEQRALLFDTGNGIGDIAAIVGKITNKPIQVLNSHSHYDHVGGNYQFDAVLGMNTEFTRGRQSGHSNAEIAIEVSKQALCKPLPNGVSEKNHVGRPYKVVSSLEDGHIIDLGSRQLEVLHIPGHTPDAIALIDRDARLMWTGDSYYAGPIWLFAAETDLGLYAKALDRMIAEIPNVDALLPAHNTPWEKPEVLIKVKQGFKTLLAGKSTQVDQGSGMVEHQIPGETSFSFLMRDEPLPYSN